MRRTGPGPLGAARKAWMEDIQIEIPPTPGARPAAGAQSKAPVSSTRMARVSSSGELHPYSAGDNARILQAMLSGAPSVVLQEAALTNGRGSRFEIRFGANAVSAEMKFPPASGIIEVDLKTERTRVVRRVTEPAAKYVAAEEEFAGSRFAHITPTGQRQLYSPADSLRIAAARAEGAGSVRLSGGIAPDGTALDPCEVRFTAYSNRGMPPTPSRTGMVQVNLASGSSSIVVDVSGGSTPHAAPGEVIRSRSAIAVDVSGGSTPHAAPGEVIRSRSATLERQPSLPPTPFPSARWASALKFAREIVSLLEASGPDVPTEEALLLVSHLHGALSAGSGAGLPALQEIDHHASDELSAALRAIVAGSMLKLCLPSSFGFGLRKNECFVAVSPATGDVVWMKKPLLWANCADDPDARAFEAELEKLPKSAYKRERLVGVVPQAPQVTTCIERSFILALERTQLVLVADDIDTKQTWVAACFAVLEQKTTAVAIAAAKDAQSVKVAAEQTKKTAAAEYLEVAKLSRAEVEAAKAQAQAEARAVEAAAKARAEASARAATAAAARAMAAADESKAQAEAAKWKAAADAEAAKAQAQAEARVAEAAAQAKAEAFARAAAEEAARAVAAADQSKAHAEEAKRKAAADAEAAKAQAQAEARAAEAAAQAKAEESARAAAEEAAKAVAAADVAIAAAAKDAQAAKDAAEAEKEASARAALAAAQEAKAQAEEAKLKAAADLKAEMERGRAQLDAQIAAYGGAGLQLEEERTCSICYDDYRGFDDGVECGGSEPHFVCNECFVASVRSSISDELGKQDLRGGRLACPFKTFPHTEGSCDAPAYDDRIVAKKVDAPTFEEYQQVRSKLLEVKFARDADVEMERKITAAIKKMQEEGVKVFQTQKHIIDNILTMSCPRCKMAFVDWDGCNAVYCTYAGCGCNFCAFCLKDCGGGVKFGQKEIVRDGGDAVHRHVNECKYAKGIGHGNDGRVQNQVWNQVRKERVEDCLREMCGTVEERRRVVENLKPQFDGLGLKITAPT